MPMQSGPLNVYNTIGFPGDIAFGAPMRVSPFNLNSNGQAQTFGFAFTVKNGANPNPGTDTPNAGLAQVGGTGVFAGILINPKESITSGTASGALNPNLNLPDNSIGQLMGEGQCYVILGNTAKIGDLAYYDNTTGAIGSVPPNASFTGVVASNVLTVSGYVAGGAPIGVGSVISGAGVTPGTVVSALGSGTGGNGTYTVTGAATVASTTMSSTAVAPAGKTFISNGRIARDDVPTANSVAVLGLS